MRVNPGQHALTVSIALIFVVCLIYVLAFGFKKFKSHKMCTKDFRIESVMHLGNKVKLMVVHVADQRLLLGVTNDSVTKLSDLKKFKHPAKSEE